MANPIKIVKKKLDGGVVAEANNDGSIFLDKKVKTNSIQAKEAISHEKVHLDQMERGDLDYDDKNVYWKGKEYPRDVMNEGSQGLPWEAEAYQKQDKYNVDENSPEFKKARGAYLDHTKQKNNNMTNPKKSPIKLSIGLSQNVLGQRAGMMEDELKMKADKHAAIGRATAQIASKVPDKFGGSGQGSWGGAQLNPTNKSKSPLKVTPITAKTSSAVKMAMPPPATPPPTAPPAASGAAAEAAADAPEVVENPAGDIAETEVDTKEVDTKEVDTKKEEGGEEEVVEEKKEEKKGGATHVGYNSNSETTSYEKGYEKEAAKQAAAKMHGKNKSKSPLKKSKSPLKEEPTTRVSTEVLKDVNVGEESGTITKNTTETDTKEEKEHVTKFRNACYDEETGNRKAEGSIAKDGTKCSWAKDEDFDPESEYEIKTHVSYDDSFEPDKETTPDTPDTTEEGDQYNMGYHEAMDAKWAAGVKGRGAKKVSRKSQAAGRAYDRKSGRGKTPIGPDGKEMTREAYVTSIAGAYQGNYDQAIGSTKSTSTTIKGTKGETITAKNKADNPNYELNEETGQYVLKADASVEMGKNKNKSPIKMNSFGGQKIFSQNKKSKTNAFKLKGWKAQ